MIKKLEGHKYAQAYVMINEYEMGYVLVSYKTWIVEALRYECGYKIRCAGLYSMTTRKHIGWFLREYFPKISYYDIKKIAGTDECIIIDKLGNVSTIWDGR